jgi:uncharacterized protein YukJ
MPLKRYGILKGTPVGHLREADDDHYQVLIKAGDTLHRIAVNVKSAAPNAPSTLLFLTTTAVSEELKEGLAALSPGYTQLASNAGGLAQDYVRGGNVKSGKMKPVPPDEEGKDNDLKDKLEAAMVKALATPDSVVYAFGEKWGPERNRADQYFRFTPGSGIHDIHMNQGNSGRYKKDNGVFQDGAVYLEYPGDQWRAFFFAFQSQTFNTDEKGNPIEAAPLPVSAKAPKKRRKAATKTARKTRARKR